MVASFIFFFFKQKTAYEMRISDWSSDVCSSDLLADDRLGHPRYLEGAMLTLEINPVTELLESCTQIGMIDRADDTVVAPQLVPMERLPFAVGHAGQIGNDGVDMSLRIEGPARVVLE